MHNQTTYVTMNNKIINCMRYIHKKKRTRLKIALILAIKGRQENAFPQFMYLLLITLKCYQYQFIEYFLSFVLFFLYNIHYTNFCEK